MAQTIITLQQPRLHQLQPVDTNHTPRSCPAPAPTACRSILPSQVRREMKLHSRLNHPNIADFYCGWEESSHFYLATDYQSGGDLYALLAE